MIGTGAHGFITQHRWAKEIGVVVNLESMGAGGRMQVLSLTLSPRGGSDTGATRSALRPCFSASVQLRTHLLALT